MTEREVLDARMAARWEDWLAHKHADASEIWLRPFIKNALSRASNVERVQRLLDEGQMRGPRLCEVEAAKADGRWPVR